MKIYLLKGKISLEAQSVAEAIQLQELDRENTKLCNPPESYKDFEWEEEIGQWTAAKLTFDLKNH